MIKLNLLKQQVQLYSKKVDALNDDFVGDLHLEKSKDIDTKYKDTKNEYKKLVLDTLSDVISELKKNIEGKSTSTASSEAMNDITLLQLTGIITESQLKAYANKYKEYPMILNYLKQIGQQNGYYLSYKNINDANKIIEDLEIKTKYFLENYDSSNVTYDDRAMLLDKGGYYDLIENSLNDFFEDTVIEITKI